MELRHTRRLLRYWVFLAIAYLIGLGSYFYYGTLHALFSSLSASVGLVGPRYLVAVIGLYYLVVFTLGIVFLAFDVRARDVREGIVEVLDARPITNFELLAGRFVGLFLAGWVPVVVLVLLMQGFGLLLAALGVPVGRTVEPMSLIALVVWMAIPAIAFSIALVFLVTLLVRHRLVAALLSLAVVIGVIALLTAVVEGPHAPLLDFFGVTQLATPSDIVPEFVLPWSTLQRIGIVLVAFGLLGFAAVVHPRLDGGSRSRNLAAAAGVLVAGAVCLALVTQVRLGIVEQRAQWQAAHEAHADQPVADIVSIAGNVAIEPGRRLDAVLEIEVEAPEGPPLDRVLFSLNPGFEVDEVTAAGARLARTHEHGLLAVELPVPLAPGERTTLALRYGGTPDTGFAYLDSTIDLERVTMNDAQIGILGYEAAIFDARHVALMPGIRWLPAAGTDVRRDDRRVRPVDYFALDLAVELPSGWLAAGPARRETIGEEAGRVRYRFAPDVALPEAALIAGPFVQAATEIRGVTFEVLLHEKHDANLAVLQEARGEIEQWVAERLEAAEGAGLEYPFDAFTLVEVPNTLRGFTGGWRLDTSLAPPAMVLLRETSLPTARFDFDFRRAFNQRPADPEGGEARVLRDRLVEFFSNDFSGGNVFAGAARSFFAHRTSATGKGAIALDHMLEELATLLVSGERTFFSAHLFRNINDTASSAVLNLGNDLTLRESLVSSRTNRLDVWETALDQPLAEIDPWEDPQKTLDVLTLKGGEMASAIYDTLGPTAVGEMLATLVANHAGGSFTLDDVIAAGEQMDDGFGALLADWVEGTGLPGFIAQQAQVYRLAGGGEPRYQVLLRVANPEPAVGFMRVGWTIERGGERVLSEPIRVPGESAVEFGVVLSEPPAVIYVHPYLALNRVPFMAALIDVGQVPTRTEEPFNGARLVDPRNPDPRIYADDLDPGFEIIDESGASAANDDVALDAGLPVAVGNGAPSEWRRRAMEASWGRYRHTTTYIGGGEGERRAVLPAELPAPGLWELEIHIPYLPFLAPDARGTWHLAVVTAQGREEIEFDARIADIGWTVVEAFELPAGEVRVEISDRTDGRMVIADAIAWSPRRVARAPGDATGDDAASATSRTVSP